jgi:hypothetical protein
MARNGSSGSATFNLQKRTLTLKPGAADLRVAIFSGSALQSPAPDMLAYLRQTQADFFIVLGGLGRSDAQALETANALSSLQRLVVVIRGGADGFDQTFATPANVVDASAVRSVRIGLDHLLLWPGAEHGRYATATSQCGFNESELQAAEDEIGKREQGERRWLLSWQATQPGSPLAAFVARAGVAGVLHAWPPSDQVAQGDWKEGPPQLVPRAWGPRMEGPDGQAMALGALVLRFDREGPHSAR